MERSLGVFGFNHLTFQEYLTAKYLSSKDKGLQIITENLKDPWWREVILLYAGLKDATPLIKAILKEEDDIFYNNLFLACGCLADAVKVDPNLRKELLKKLYNLYWNGKFELWRENALSTLVDIATPEVLTHFIEKLKDEDSRVRVRSAYALGNLGKDTTEIIKALRDALKDEDLNVRMSSVYALGNLGKDIPVVINTLIDALKDEDQDFSKSYIFMTIPIKCNKLVVQVNLWKNQWKVM
ncbi:MAG: HEAT repeat domain-containing protein [Methanosarcinales archaeon]